MKGQILFIHFVSQVLSILKQCLLEFVLIISEFFNKTQVILVVICNVTIYYLQDMVWDLVFLCSLPQISVRLLYGRPSHLPQLTPVCIISILFNFNVLLQLSFVLKFNFIPELFVRLVKFTFLFHITKFLIWFSLSIRGDGKGRVIWQGREQIKRESIHFLLALMSM